MDPISSLTFLGSSGTSVSYNWWIGTFSSNFYYNGGGTSAVDSAGNIYFTASLYDGTNYNGHVNKINPQGVTQWVRKYRDTSTSSLNIQNLGVDSSDNVYSMGQNVVAKYNSSGTLQWIKKATIGSTSALAVVWYGGGVDSAGNVYMAGQSNDPTTGAFVQKLNSSGTLQWVSRLWFSSGPYYQGRQCVIDEVNDRLYMIWSQGGIVSRLQTSTGNNVSTASYNTNINLNSFGCGMTGYSGEQTLNVVGNDSSNNGYVMVGSGSGWYSSGIPLYCVGVDKTSSISFYFGGAGGRIIKLINGTFSWARQFSSIGDVQSITHAGSGILYAIGNSGIVKIPDDGTRTTGYAISNFLSSSPPGSAASYSPSTSNPGYSIATPSYTDVSDSLSISRTSL